MNLILLMMLMGSNEEPETPEKEKEKKDKEFKKYIDNYRKMTPKQKRRHNLKYNVFFYSLFTIPIIGIILMTLAIIFKW